MTLDEKLIPLLKLQLEKLLDYYNEGTKVGFMILANQLKETLNKLKQLKIRNGLGEIDKESYILTIEFLSNEIHKIERELQAVQPI